MLRSRRHPRRYRRGRRNLGSANVDFQGELSGCAICCEAGPLFCLDVESLEVCSNVFKQPTLANVFEQWFQQDPGLMQPSGAFRYTGTFNPSKWFEQEKYALAMRVASILIDPAELASDQTLQKVQSDLNQPARSSDSESNSNSKELSIPAPLLCEMWEAFVAFHIMHGRSVI